MHHRNHAAGIREPGAPREAAHHVEEMKRVEVDLFVERLHRRDLLLIDRQPVLRLAQAEIHGQLAEEWRVFRARLAVAERHHVVIERGQRFRLEVIPEALGIGRDALVDRRAAGDVGLDPSGGHAHALVVGKAIEERPLDHRRLEGLPEQLGAASRGDDDFVRRRSDRHHLEANVPAVDLELCGQDLVDRIKLQQPARRREHALLLPA